jgi:hypothetical protein
VSRLCCCSHGQALASQLKAAKAVTRGKQAAVKKLEQRMAQVQAEMKSVLEVRVCLCIFAFPIWQGEVGLCRCVLGQRMAQVQAEMKSVLEVCACGREGLCSHDLCLPVRFHLQQMVLLVPIVALTADRRCCFATVPTDQA